MSNSFYFPHDNDAFSDEKIIDLRIKHGMAGYGTYWALIEYLHQNDGYIDYDTKRIAFALQIEEKLLKSVIDDFCLFKIKEKKVFSERLLAHLEQRSSIAKKRKEAGMKGGKAKALAIAKQVSSKTLAKSSKGKERKGKENKEKEEEKKEYSTIESIKTEEVKQELSTYYDIRKIDVEEKIEDLEDYCGRSGREYVDYKLALRSFLRSDIKSGKLNKTKKTITIPEDQYGY